MRTRIGRRGLFAIVLTLAHLAEAPSGAVAQRAPTPPLNPTTYTSRSGAYTLDVNAATTEAGSCRWT